MAIHWALCLVSRDVHQSATLHLLGLGQTCWSGKIEIYSAKGQKYCERWCLTANLEYNIDAGKWSITPAPNNWGREQHLLQLLMQGIFIYDWLCIGFGCCFCFHLLFISFYFICMDMIKITRGWSCKTQAHGDSAGWILFSGQVGWTYQDSQQFGC